MSRAPRDIPVRIIDPETSRQGDGAAPATDVDRIDPREPVGSVHVRSPWRMAARRFRAHKMAMLSLILLVMIVLLAFIGGALWHYKYNIYSNDLSFKPSLKHPFGTDSTGFDTFSQVLRGTQRSLEIAMFVSISSTIVGTIYGAVSGYAGGMVDSFMMRIVDAGLSIPYIMVVVILSVVFHPDTVIMIFIIAVFYWLGVARLVRGETLSLRTREYVQAVKVIGGGRSRAVVRHIVPNAIGTIIVQTTFAIADSILILAGLGFLGLGVQSPATDWGDMLSGGLTYLQSGSNYWWLIYPPGIAIILTCIAFNFIGDALRDSFETRLQRR